MIQKFATTVLSLQAGALQVYRDIMLHNSV